MGSQRSAHEGKGDVQIGSCTVRPFAELETKIKSKQFSKRCPSVRFLISSIVIIFKSGTRGGGKKGGGHARQQGFKSGGYGNYAGYKKW
jgi:hypothetical protein